MMWVSPYYKLFILTMFYSIIRVGFNMWITQKYLDPLKKKAEGQQPIVKSMFLIRLYKYKFVLSVGLLISFFVLLFLFRIVFEDIIFFSINGLAFGWVIPFIFFYVLFNIFYMKVIK